MKQLSVIAFWCLIIIPILSLAQGPHKRERLVERGIKGGMNFDNMHGNYWSNTYKTGLNGGVYAGMHEHYLGVQLEALITSASYLTEGNYNGYYDVAQVKNLYLNIPALFEIRLVPNLWLQLGPQYSLLLNSKFSGASSSDNIFNASTFSGVVGLRIPVYRGITMGGRYIFGLTDADGLYSSEAWKQHSMQLFVGFRVM